MKKRIATSLKIADLKKRLRNTAELEYQKALQQRQELVDLLHQKQRELEEAETRMKSNCQSDVSVVELQAWDAFLATTRLDIHRLESEIRRLDTVCEGKRADLVERYVDEKKWNQYHERLVWMHHKQILQEERKLLDELAVQKSSRVLG
jgi:flagellar export protein FliJ